jgi:hypothetical protein
MNSRGNSSKTQKLHRFCYVDTEFSNFARSTQIMLQEVTFLDIYGDVLLDVCIQDSNNETYDATLSAKTMELPWNRNILPMPNQEAISLSSLAQKMKSLGLGHQTTFVQWGRTPIDSRVLSNGFNQLQLNDIIDPKKVLLPLYEWRRFLPDSASFAMDIFSP